MSGGDARSFEEVEVGLVLPGATVEVTPTQLFLFSAATGNAHRVHYDRAWAVDVEHHADLLVQGPLQAALLLRVVTDWLPPGGRLLSYSYEHRGSAHPGRRLHLSGAVTGRADHDGHDVVEVGLRVCDDAGRVVLPGSARAELPRLTGTPAGDAVPLTRPSPHD